MTTLQIEERDPSVYDNKESLGLEHGKIRQTIVYAIKPNFLFPIHHPHLYPVNTKTSIISVFFHYFLAYSGA